MAQYAKLEVIPREETGAKTAKALRKEDKIPTNYYYSGQENENLAIDRKVFRQAIHSGSHIFEIEHDGESQYVMIKEVQYHPVNDEIMHIDLMRVRRDVKMNISVPILLEGTAVGVKEGGILTQNLQTLEISCLPSDVPDNIVVDVSEFELNHVMNVSELEVPENIDIVTAGDMDVLAIVSPKEESLEPEIPSDEELEEGTLAEEGEKAPVESDQVEETSTEEGSKEEAAE
jgi:large subunit ribosomal protein L25